MEQDLTTGSITRKLLLFAIPLMVGNVLQQFYNIVDTWIVGKYIGSDALAVVGSAYVNDVSRIHHLGTLYGQQCLFCNPVWKKLYGAF